LTAAFRSRSWRIFGTTAPPKRVIERSMVIGADPRPWHGVLWLAIVATGVIEVLMLEPASWPAAPPRDFAERAAAAPDSTLVAAPLQPCRYDDFQNRQAEFQIRHEG
jgi:hypothetical protein